MMRRLTLPLLLIVVGAALVCFGVMTKATHICLECIGIG